MQAAAINPTDRWGMPRIFKTVVGESMPTLGIVKKTEIIFRCETKGAVS